MFASRLLSLVRSRFALAGVLRLFGLLWAASAFGQALPSYHHGGTPAGIGSGPSIELSLRHIVILNADLENIWGSYFFAVHNKTETPQAFQTKVMLPKATVDFRPQEGLSEADLKLGSDGSLLLDKTFQPGLSLLSVAFQVKVNPYGEDVLKFQAPTVLGELSIAVPKSSRLHLQAAGMDKGLPPMLAKGQYDGLMRQGAVAEGELVQVSVSGVPKGRFELWMLGALVALVLLVLGGLLTLKTRPLGEEGSVGLQDIAM